MQSGSQEPLLQALQGAETEVFHDVDGRCSEQVSDTLAPDPGERDQWLERVFCDELPKWKEEVGGHGRGEVETEVEIWILE